MTDLLEPVETEKPSVKEIDGLILSWLEELGSNAYAVAGNLSKLGIKGVPGCVAKCPIANFLRGNLEKIVGYSMSTVQVGTKDAVVRIGPDIAPFHEVRLNLPEPIGDFISLFDRNQFPGLDGDNVYY